MLANYVPAHIKPVFDDLIDTMASYGYSYDDNQSKNIIEGSELTFVKDGVPYTITVLNSGHDLWPLFADGFVARKIVEKILAGFGEESQGCRVDERWLNDFR